MDNSVDDDFDFYTHFTKDNQILDTLEYDQFLDLRQDFNQQNELNQQNHQNQQNEQNHQNLLIHLIKSELDFNQEQFSTLDYNQQSICNEFSFENNVNQISNQINDHNDRQTNQIISQIDDQLNSEINNQINDHNDQTKEISDLSNKQIDNPFRSSSYNEFDDLKPTIFFLTQNDDYLTEYEFDSTSENIFNDINFDFNNGDKLDKEQAKRDDVKTKLDDYIKSELFGITEDFELNHELDEKLFCELCNKFFNLPVELTEHLCSQNLSVNKESSSKSLNNKNNKIKKMIKCNFCLYTTTEITKVLQRKFLF